MRIRLYLSALNDVRYVFGAPVRYNPDPKVCEQREALKAKVVAASKGVEA